MKPIPINKILVANRGEIAIRIIRAAKEMNIKTVAVYSEADRAAPHVRMADEAILLGPGPARESYLKMDRVIQACKESGADAIHPGYGFLSENPEFASLVESAGIIFIGPKSSTMRIMGDKLSAKDLAKKLNVPLVPGSDGPVKTIEEAQEVAKNIGFPMLIKASAGGGGKGMRIVHNPSDFNHSLQMAINEALSAFGDGSVFLEKYISSPRHIEIQIMADRYGNTVYLFERECSVQRRHQKVIEEAPSSLLTPELRKEMGESAVRISQHCGYLGAGTIEFIVDPDQNFYFLEMNTRLQVEHPVTEMITGIDLVKEQIRVARGEPLSFGQEGLKMQGHAIELRIYAEDPLNGFLPDTGILNFYSMPSGPGVRVDNGVEPGTEVSIYYDPMLSKLVTYGRDRTEAIERMIRAIGEYNIKGVANTLLFGDFVMRHPSFREGNFDTHFVQKYFTPSLENGNKNFKEISHLDEEEIKEEEEIAITFAVNKVMEGNSMRRPLESQNLNLSSKSSGWRRRIWD